MGRVRTTRDEYIVQGAYGQGWEDLTAHDTRDAARADLRSYSANEYAPHRIIKRRVKLDPTDIEPAAPLPRRWTIQEIKRANVAAGYHFFSRDTMRWFGNRMRDFRVYHVRPFHGDQEIYVTAHNHCAPAGVGRVSVYRFNPDTGDVSKVNVSPGELSTMRRYGMTAEFYKSYSRMVYEQG